jgi:hypothetical protein
MLRFRRKCPKYRQSIQKHVIICWRKCPKCHQSTQIVSACPCFADGTLITCAGGGASVAKLAIAPPPAGAGAGASREAETGVVGACHLRNTIVDFSRFFQPHLSCFTFYYLYYH